MNSLRFLNATDQAEFDTKGYLVRRLFDTKSAARLKAEFEQRHADKDLTPNQESNYVSALDLNRDEAKAFSDWIWAAWSEPLQQIIAGFRQVDAGMLIKQSGAGPVGIHQHSVFTDRPFSQTIIVWCPLADCDEVDGCLHLVPGSQRLVRHVNVIGKGGYITDPQIMSKVLRDHGVVLPLKAGEAVFFENSLLHGSLPNESGRSRIAMGGYMVSADENLAFYHAFDDHLAVFPVPGDGHLGRNYIFDRNSVLKQPPSRHLPLWTEKPNLAQIDELLRRNGPRASEDYDPLDTVRHLATPPEIVPEPRAAQSAYQTIRHTISRIPGARFAYRTIKSLDRANQR